MAGAAKAAVEAGGKGAAEAARAGPAVGGQAEGAARARAEALTGQESVLRRLQPLKPPLLVERHNARPGMVLFYSAQGLVFAKLGSTVRDKDKEFGMALKQAETNLRAAKFLPGDFKLTAAA